jgi:nitrogen fixation NifU-like protein
MTEILKEKTLDQAKALFNHFHSLCTGEDALSTVNGKTSADDMERLEVLSGVQEFPVRVKCATLAWHAMMAALEGKKEISTEND